MGILGRSERRGNIDSSPPTPLLTIMKVVATHCFPLHGVANEGEPLTITDPLKDGQTCTYVLSDLIKT